MADQAPPNGNDAEEKLTPNPEHRDMLLRGVEEWNQWREENEAIEPNLQGANLKGADLQEADLKYAVLTRADLRDADLTGAYLTDAYLTDADLTGAKLTDAVLTGAKLTGAFLPDADLTRAVLTRANLRQANLTGADLTGAVLTDADLVQANVFGVRNPQGFLSKAVHRLGAVCFDLGEWRSWRGDRAETPAYPEDEIELAELCGVSVPSDSIES